MPPVTSSLPGIRPMSLGWTFHCILLDARRKRLLRGRRADGWRALLGLFSINVIAVALWRFSMYFMRKRLPKPATLIYYLNVMLFGFDASPYSQVGPGLVVVHLVGCVVHGRFGANCTFFGRNGIGGKGDDIVSRGWLGGPLVGNGVTFGFASGVLSWETIGDGAMVGGAAWVFGAVEPGVLVVGTPAKVLRQRTPEELAKDKLGHVS